MIKKQMPSMASIKRLCKAVRLIDDTLGLTVEALEALRTVEKQMKGRRK